ncbi:unnamed protein product, partial [Choristocarpus tenellus]
LDLLEQGAALKIRMFGHQSSAARIAFRDAVMACNSLAMATLGGGGMKKCRSLLARAMGLATGRRKLGGGKGKGRSRGKLWASFGSDPALEVLTLNNTACLFRRLGEPKQALKCLQRAVEVARMAGSTEHLAVTHLNACAVLSQLGRHEVALEHAQSAVFYGQEGLIAPSWNNEKPERRGLHEVGEQGGRQGRLATLAVSYYNLAVELEFTNHKDLCFHWYNKAVLLAKNTGIHNEELLKTFQRSFAAARKVN